MAARPTPKFLAEFQQLTVVHRILEAAAQELGTLGHVCMPNCGRCCLDNTVRILECEAAYVVSGLLAQPGRLRRVLSIAAGWLQESAGFDRRPASSLSQQELYGEYVKAVSAPCPFLSTDKGCLIYEVRPVVCRAYGVTRTTGPECPRPISQMRPAAPYIGGEPEAKVKSIMGALSRGATSGLLPTLVLLVAEPQRARRLVDQGAPAGKLLLRDDDLPGVLTQDQWIAEMGRRAEGMRQISLSHEAESPIRPSDITLPRPVVVG